MRFSQISISKKRFLEYEKIQNYLHKKKEILINDYK